MCKNVVMKNAKTKNSSWSFNNDGLRVWREFAELSPEQLGKDLGVSGQTIRNYEDGKIPKTIKVLLTLVNKHKINPGLLFTQKDQAA